MAFPIQRHPPIPPRASQPRVDKCILSLLPRCKGWGQSGCRMPQNKGASRSLCRGHLPPPGQIKEDCRGHLEEMVLFFAKSIRPTLNRAFCPPSLGLPGKRASRSLKISY